ncbi:TPA: CesT family type III secretion system chaperone VecA [Vibrio parahaemolyticus]|uniref:CesT family type III secretion system chaperone VecA n=1 Tax=Vibrio parahaemolyticus TaxID=670 RepID=UPI001B82160C|nr:CesT family type III secretion system chaperone VecA [Vibrio parahaemolyticus]HBC3374265.1 CesT family type III secretion system chaperone VecA [Vibrio parahaemolyticus]HBH7861404.1 CesT family type III secretion system chaperone VecA [Vibrio parahaemolyticus]HBH7903459.1 CesT family type III secretion system chaperone VecA [Vibrio parahaemolyticus]
MNTIQPLLDEFCRLNELPPLILEDGNRCQLLVDDRFVLYFTATGDDALMLSVAFGGLEKSGELRIRGLELLARANYQRVGSGNLALSLAPNGRQLVLVGRQPTEHLNSANLTVWFHEIIEQTELWQARFAMLDQDLSATSNHEQSHVQPLRV